MRAILVLFFVLICVTVEAATQGSHESATRAEQSAAAEVLSLNQEWAEAEVSEDMATLERILDDRFVFTDEYGKTINKAAFIAEARHFSLVSQSLDQDIVQIHGDTAVVVGTSTVHFLAAGEVQAMTYRFTVTYIKRHRQWYAVAQQLARVGFPR